MRKLFVIFIGMVSCIIFFRANSQQSPSEKVDLVVFSFNRPLQLYAFLESAEKYLTGLGERHVIYRASDDSFSQGYQAVKDRFENVIFHKQGSNPNHDFKVLTLQASFESKAPYIIYAVDDIVVKDFVDLSLCADALEKYDAYGFFLRLGTNTTFCYSMRRGQGTPPLKKENDDILSWHFHEGRCDWAYPNNVDMTLFRKRDIEHMLRSPSYSQPNRMEEAFMRSARAIYRRKGLCFQQSKIVNLPLNIVQNVLPNNPASHEYSPQELIEKFSGGLKMDIGPLKQINNKSAHMNFSPTFISR